MDSFQKMVMDFNIAVNAKRAQKGVPELVTPELRCSLIQEETQETVEALVFGDDIETIDGLCDLLYVTYGAADVFGIDLDVNEVHGAFSTIEHVRLSIESTKKAINMLIAASDRAVTAIKEGDLKNIKGSLDHLVVMCWWTGQLVMGVDLRPFFEEVHRSNMEKTTGPKRADGKQLKPEGWKPPRIAEMYKEMKITKARGSLEMCRGITPPTHGCEGDDD